MPVKSIMTKENIEKCLPYVDEKYQAHFLELMQNIEILISESLTAQERQLDDKKIIRHKYKITVLRTDFKSRAVYSFSYSDYNEDRLNLKMEPNLCKILSEIRTAYNKNHSHLLRQIFTDCEIMVLPLLFLQ